jgi:chemotaxis protein CheD
MGRSFPDGSWAEQQEYRGLKVDISDARVSNDPQECLVTYALGSCMGVCLYDPAAPIGGMLHCLLPDSTRNPTKAEENPFVFADTGLTLLLEHLLSLGASKRRLQVKLAGGAARVETTASEPAIGKQNYLAVRKALWKSGLFIHAEDVGGTTPRTMTLYVADGSVVIQARGNKWSL